MKKNIITVLLCVSFLFIRFVHAQTDTSKHNSLSDKPYKIFIAINAGMDFPNINGYSKGYGFQLNVGYYFNSRLGIRADIEADFINREDQMYHNPDGVTEKVTGRNMKLITFKADLLYGNFDANSFVNTYILVGAGVREKNYSSRTYAQTYFSYFTNSDTTKRTMNEAYWKTDFSVGIGAGINLKLANKLRFTGELQYMMLEGLSMGEEKLMGTNALFKIGIAYLF